MSNLYTSKEKSVFLITFIIVVYFEFHFEDEWVYYNNKVFSASDYTTCLPLKEGNFISYVYKRFI